MIGKPGKKSFMYFASSAGRGFIISDDEEITGVISVRNKVLRNWDQSLINNHCINGRKREEHKHHLSETRYLIQSAIHWKRKRRSNIGLLNQLTFYLSTDQTFPRRSQSILWMVTWSEVQDFPLCKYVIIWDTIKYVVILA